LVSSGGKQRFGEDRGRRETDTSEEKKKIGMMTSYLLEAVEQRREDSGRAAIFGEKRGSSCGQGEEGEETSAVDAQHRG